MHLRSFTYNHKKGLSEKEKICETDFDLICQFLQIWFCKGKQKYRKSLWSKWLILIWMFGMAEKIARGF